MNKGKIKWYNAVKGYGFIELAEGNDIFVHQTGLINPYEDIQPGQEVEFETKQGEKGLVAVNVKIIK